MAFIILSKPNPRYDFLYEDIRTTPSNLLLSELFILAFGKVAGGTEVDDRFSNDLENEI